MKTLIILIILIIGVCGFCYHSWKLWAWLCKDPRDPHQTITDEKFRQAKNQDRILANGFVDNEEKR